MLEKGDMVALVEPDIFAVKAQQENKAIRVNYTSQLLKLLECIYSPKDAQAEKTIQTLQDQHNVLVTQIQKGKMEAQLAPFIEEEKRLMQERKALIQATLLANLSSILSVISGTCTRSGSRHN